MYGLTIDFKKEGSFFTVSKDVKITHEQLEKICDLLNFDKIKFNKIPDFEDIGNLTIECEFNNECTIDDLFDDDHELVMNSYGPNLASFLSNFDFGIDWYEDTSEAVTSFKATIENKYVITFDIEEGDCIEDGIYETDVVNLKIIKVLQ